MKSALISQSFSPLYLLMLIRYMDIDQIKGFIHNLLISSNNIKFIKADLINEHGSVILTIILSIISIFIIIRGILTYICFGKLWKTNSVDKGEKITVTGYESDVGITFFVTYVLPLMLDDVNTIRGFLVFLVLMIMMEVLLRRCNLYYQNPVLTMMGYKVFRFKFADTTESGYRNKVFIGLIKGSKIDETKPVKRRILEDDIVIVFEKK